MKKRILAFVLALLTAVNTIPYQIFAQASTETSNETTIETTTETSNETSNETSTNTESVDNCVYCEETIAEDGTVIHGENCNTRYAVDASADVGKTAAFTMAYGEVIYINEQPHAGLVYDTSADNYNLFQTMYDPDDPPMVEITNWYWEVSGPTLWYQVKPLDGETLPEGLTTESWILQNYTDDSGSIDTLILTDVDMIGKMVKFDRATVTLYESLTDAYYDENPNNVNATAFPCMVVKDLYTDSEFTWYYLDAVEGETWPEDHAGYHYALSTDVTVVTTCPICGNPGCTEAHNTCSVCGEINCTEAHVYCPACGEPDCDKTHTYCAYCNTYDSCTIDHLAENRPITAPVLPDGITLPEGVDIAIFDAAGEMLSELILSAGQRTSISAWSTLEGTVSYQWQIRYDAEKDLWVDIQGQTEKGMVVSPAMFLSVIEDQGSAAIRCVARLNEETKVSVAIPVIVVDQPTMASYGLRSNAVLLAEGEGDGNENLQKAYVVVQYVYSDGRTAAASDFAEVIPGIAIEYDYPLPPISGYKATLENAGDHASIKDGVLTVTYAEGELAADEYKQIKVVYQPDYVRYTIIHYWQNVNDDRYTEHEREVIDMYDSNLSDNDRAHRTGEVIADAHKTYPGFYNLLYETPMAAADGSTVIEVYYDRYYYWIKFDLGDTGYGVDPIYARAGAEIEFGTPVQAGYTFLGWSLNGVNVDPPTQMPLENRTYTARWQPKGEVNYTIVYWKENANDNNYSYWTQRPGSAIPGTKVSGSNSVANYVDDAQYFTYNDHLTDKDVVVKGDGSTIVNVYYNRNYYTLIFYYDGECNIEAHTHGTGCNLELICGSNGHAHDSECERTLVCTIKDHTHSADCTPDCDLPIHTAHTASCLVCTKELHAAHTDDCYTLNCKHTHTVDCYSAESNRTLRTTDKPDQLGNNLADGIHTYTRYSQTYYYLKIGNTWYCAHRNNGNSSSTTRIYESCKHTHSSNNNSCYDLTCTLPLHVEHTEAEGCYSDVVHPQHTDSCYDHISHSHTEECYVYKCGETPHEHDSTCYRECTIYEHTHGNSCQYSNNNTAKIFRVITAKYEQNISDQWPTADDIDNFSYWESTVQSRQSSKIVTLTSNYCVDGLKLLAHTSTTKYTLNYWFEHYDQTVTPDGKTYKEYDGRIYKLSADYSQTVNYNFGYNTKSWSYKKITGLTAITDESAKVESGNVFNLYYNRKRVSLSFFNVSGIVKTVSDLMFEQPLADYVDTDDKLLSEFEPEFPTGSYEPGSRVFGDWYTTPECIPGTEVDFSDFTMPANDLTIYAKWEPVEHRVNYYMSKESLERDETIPTEMARRVNAAVAAGVTRPSTDPYTKVFEEDIIKHGSYAPAPGDPGVAEGYEAIHPYTGYDFIGWFYLTEDGRENGFDPTNIPVNSDLNLYAKWSSNTLCYYNVYFALDVKNNTTGADGSDGIADVDASGKVIYIADSITGSAIAGHTYTFSAKGGEELYNLGEGQNYREGYFPTTGSHSITIDIADVDGTGANSYTFLYQQKSAIPYTVKYLIKGTNEPLFADKVVTDNKNVIVTENFQYKQGYMPEEYQLTLIVTDDGNAENDVIIFYYTKDEQHALYVVNYYIQDLNQNLTHKGWSKYDDLQSTGTIGDTYEAEAININGFTLSQSYTDKYNTSDKINGMTGVALPSVPISALTSDDKLSGKLSDKGMELNFYYTRNLYPYEFRYMLSGTTVELAETEVGMAGYDTTVTGYAKEIRKDLDGDGIYEDYRLYDPAETTKDIHIKTDGEALSSGDVVSKGQAKVNVTTFFYVRCTQTMTITKVVEDKSAVSDPDPDQEFTFSLLIHAKEGYHRNSYDYKITEGADTVATGTLEPVLSAPNILQFTLKAGQTITIEGLPTAEYTLTELNVPTGYYDSYNTTQTNGRYKLTVDSQVDAVVTNTYEPANLSISKTVNVEEEGTNTPEVKNFEFTITFPTSVAPAASYNYIVNGVAGTQTATVADGKMVISLEKGQTVTFINLPVGAYTVTEKNYKAFGYDSNYSVNNAAVYTEGSTALLNLTRNTTQTVDFLNRFPVGDLAIEKTVSKEFYGTAWSGDTFTFTVERTTTGRPLINNNQYKVFVDGVEQAAKAVVNGDKLTVTITFDAVDAAKLDEASEQGVTIKHTLVIKNLPAGTYKVTETPDADYVQTPDGLTVSDLNIPAEAVTASFTNTLKRKTGTLSLEKELVAAEGYNPSELPAGTKFSFTIELLEVVPTEKALLVVDYPYAKYSDGTNTIETAVLSGGRVTVMLEKDWNVKISGLPEGKYRIIESTIPSYANAFAHKVNGSWKEQPSQTTADGQMFTEIDVTPDADAEVKCTNTYPVNRAELIIQKLVTKEYSRDTLPGGNFTFTITLEKEDADSYNYKIYDAYGQVGNERVATVTNKVFTITLEAGQYAVIPHMPVCGYTVSEDVSTTDYSTSYRVYVSETGDAPSTTVNTGALNDSGTGTSVSRTFSAGKTDALVFTNVYKRHLGTLTIYKDVKGTSEKDTFIFHISGNGVEMDVTITGSDSVKIYDLPLGTYTVTEDTEWSWRYTADKKTAAVNLKNTPDGEVTFTNTYINKQWLNHIAAMPNTFGKTKEENGGD